MKGVYLLLSFFIFSNLTAQDLAVSSIPDSLQKGADAVVRYEHHEVNFINIDKYELKAKRIITVLKKSGEEYLTFREYYKKGSSEIQNIKISIYDANGKLIREVKPKEIEDYASYDGSSLISDGRIKYFKYHTVEYPVTMAMEYLEKSSNTMILERWFPIYSYNVSVESSTLNIINRANIPLRIKEQAISSYTSISNEGQEYRMIRQPIVNRESFGGAVSSILPNLLISPESFSYEGYKGSVNDWESFGKWMYRSFLSDRNDLDQVVAIRDLRNVVYREMETRDIIRKLYDYVQENTRYVLITLDEGGYQPLTAGKVHDVKYGDCKALSFYMKSLLEMFGIKSNYAVLYADTDQPIDMYSDYASVAPGNHVILNIPMAMDGPEDDIWVDCTSGDNPVNFLGSYSDNRLAVLIKPEGGELIKTPRYGMDQNVLYKKINLTISDQNQASGEVIHKGGGLFIENTLGIKTLDREDLKKYLINGVFEPIQSIKILNSAFEIVEDSILSYETYNIEVDNFGEVAGEYLLLPIKISDNDIPKLPKDSKRRTPIVFYRDKHYIEEMRYKIPSGYEFRPFTDISLETKYGSYSLNISQTEDQSVLVKKDIKIFEGHYDPKEYGDIKHFLDMIVKNERSLVTLKKK